MIEGDWEGVCRKTGMKYLLKALKDCCGGVPPSICKILLKKTHAADLSLVFRDLSKENRTNLFRLIDDVEKKGVLFSELEENIFLELIEEIEIKDAVQVFENMGADDVAELLNLMDQDMAEKILSEMKNEDSIEVEHIMSYGEDTAGSIMVPDFIALKEDMGARDVIEALQSDYLDV